LTYTNNPDAASGCPKLVYKDNNDSTVFSEAVSNSYSLKYNALAYAIHLSAFLLFLTKELLK